MAGRARRKCGARSSLLTRLKSVCRYRAAAVLLGRAARRVALLLHHDSLLRRAFTTPMFWRHRAFLLFIPPSDAVFGEAGARRLPPWRAHMPMSSRGLLRHILACQHCRLASLK